MLTLVVAGLAAGGACAIFGVSIVVLHRMAGVVNFSQAVVGAFGAYVAAVGVERGWDLLVALAAGVVLSSALSTAIGLLFARLFSETGAAVRTAAMIATTVGLFAAGFRCFGDTPRGVPVLLPGVSASIGGVVVAAGLIEGNRVHPPGFADSNEGFFLFCAVTLGAVGAGVTVLRRARAGRWWSCVRHSERATAAMGRSVVVTKLSAFAVSAAVAGLGGALLLALNGIVSGASFQPIESMTILTSALIFGAGHFEGAVLTGLFGQLIPNFLSDVGLPRDIAPMIFAVGGVIALSRGEGGLSAALRGVAGKVRRAARSSEPDVGTGAAAEDIRPGRRPTSSTVLDIRGVSVSYGAVKALQDVSLSVPEGGFVGLIGPNGAGKSTLVDTLSGFIVRHEGHVLLDGEDVTALSPRRRAHRGMRRTFQQGHTPRDLTVGGYLELAATRAGAPAGEALGWFRLPPAPTPIPMTESPRTQLARPAGPGLRVEALRVHRMGQPVVRGVDLSVAPGEVTVLLGANGAGKSTLLDGISGVVPAAAGRVILDGEAAPSSRASLSRRTSWSLQAVPSWIQHSTCSPSCCHGRPSRRSCCRAASSRWWYSAGRSCGVLAS